MLPPVFSYAMPVTKAKTKETEEDAVPTLVGWQGLRFLLPPDWNVTGFSLSTKDGYLKVDSPGTMFVQVRWTDPHHEARARTLFEWGYRLWKKRRNRDGANESPVFTPPNLRAMLDHFLAETGRQAKRGKQVFDCKVKPETSEANGERTAHNFAWTGGGQGQGKIWHCRVCGRVFMAQVVGQGRDPIAAVAAQMFGSLCDHAQQGWNTWALYDLVAGIPDDFRLTDQKLMSGYLKLEFTRRGGERIRVERWGLANVSRRKFTLKEWLRESAGARDCRVTYDEDFTVQAHAAARATGRIHNPLDWAAALRESVGTRRIASLYDACAWECAETNKLYAIQVWHHKGTSGLLEEAAARCECH